MKTLIALYAITITHSSNLILSNTAYNKTKRKINLKVDEM
jgi:hypothetical protein